LMEVVAVASALAPPAQGMLTSVPLAAGLPLTVALVAQPGIRTRAAIGLEAVTVMVALSPKGYSES
jgi:hypothetical protein